MNPNHQRFEQMLHNIGAAPSAAEEVSALRELLWKAWYELDVTGENSLLGHAYLVERTAREWVKAASDC